MSHKQNLHAILAKLKAWSEHSGNEELDNHIKELENEINATEDTGDDGDDEPGGDVPPPPDVP